MRKILLIVAVIAIIIGGFLVWDKFLRKTINYGNLSGEENVTKYREDCARRGGVLNECGSPPGNFLTACYFICELK